VKNLKPGYFRFRSHSLQFRKGLVLSCLAMLAALVTTVGIYQHQYFIVFVFCVWLCSEALLLRLQPLLRWSLKKERVPSQTLVFEEQFWALYAEGTENSEILSELRLADWLRNEQNEENQKWASQFRALFSFKLLFTKNLNMNSRKKKLTAFCFLRGSHKNTSGVSSKSVEFTSLSEIQETAITMSDLLGQILTISESESGRLGVEAKSLIETVIGIPYDAGKARTFIDSLSHRIQQNYGVPFLMLNLISQGERELARELGRDLLSGRIPMDEDTQSTLYWLAEIDWFNSEKKKEILDHDAVIRYLYHLCFIAPDRAGILEVDSQFAGELGPINEIVEEGFLFKETLIEAFLELWQQYEGWFDGVMQGVLEAMTGRKSKIYDELPNWWRYWRQEKKSFSKDYLYVVEGNLCFADGQFQDALFCYRKALDINPKMRSALFNLLMASAKVKDKGAHEWVIQQILKFEEWRPLSLLAIGNSYLLCENETVAESFYQQVTENEGWTTKIDYYISMFCLEQGFSDKALQYAKKANEVNPSDTSISFHLSRCYKAVGESETALQLFKKVQGSGELSQAPWLNFYQFTLERDSGRTEEASRTLLNVPKDYLSDTNELDSALDFARKKKDFNLMRHLK
jgi:tetratricopeptide (TPR) repeat protein